MNKLSNQPVKGTADWFPEEYAVRKYIFDTWRKVCISFGYQEYLAPVVENAEVYRAKSGEDVGGTELMSFFDRGGREMAIRPEMTPSVTRMVTQIYESSPKPIRYFSIANFFRNEKPQKGRNREFWQLNADMFGSDSINADIEVLRLSLELLLAFNPPKNSFVLNVNNRKLIDYILNEIAKVTETQRIQVVRVLDKWQKLPIEEIRTRLAVAGLSANQTRNLELFMTSTNSEQLVKNLPEIKESEGFKEIETIISTLNNLGYSEWVAFQPNIIRGFDYYDGMVFEVSDKNPENPRALFGGGRYNGLAGIFGSQSFPAVGFAPGDETTKLFLQGWNLIPENLKPVTYYLPLLSEELVEPASKLAQKLRNEGKNVIQGLELQKFGKAFDYANKIKADYVVIFGEDERGRGEYQIKDMKKGEQTTFKL